MDNSDLITRRMSSVVTTGMAHVGLKPTVNGADGTQSTEAFQNVLKQKLAQNSDLTFSKHAVDRVVERNVEISDSSIARLSEGVRLAQEKGLNDTLVLIDATAYIVNAKNGTVITTVNNEDLKGNVFTNIDGTVIM